MNLFELYDLHGLPGIRNAMNELDHVESRIESFEPFLKSLLGICRENFATLEKNLTGLEYRFGDLPEDPNYWKEFPVFSGKSQHNIIEEFERSMGRLPLAYRLFHEEIGGVNFIGYHPDWPDVEWLDPIFIDPITDTFLDTAIEEKEAWELDKEDDPDEETEPYFPLPVSPDNFHKANISGGPSYSILLNDADPEGTLIYYHDRTIRFLDYLQKSFEYGGFLGLHYCSTEIKSKVPMKEITKNLTPIK